MPASRLSYFPPTSQIHSDELGGTSISGTFPRRHKPSENGSYPSTIEAWNPSSRVHPQGTFPNITSLFSAFPTAVSSPREGIISRLSLDSNRTSGTPSSDGQEHEMDEMETSSFRRTQDLDVHRNPAPAEGLRPSIQARRSTSSGYLNSQYVAEGISITSTPVVRTSQLEPSPDMRLPMIVRKKSKSSTDYYNGQSDLGRL